MRKVDSSKWYRCVDANVNRAREGLRVCEDVCRFFWDNRSFTRKFKEIRHRLTTAVDVLGAYPGFVSERDIDGDVGRLSTPSEMYRETPSDVFWANAQRVKESVRVLEELAKLAPSTRNPKFSSGKSPAESGNYGSAEQFKNLRYGFYALEKEICKSGLPDLLTGGTAVSNTRKGRGNIRKGFGGRVRKGGM